MIEDPQDRETIVARYVEGPVQLEAAIAGLSEAELDIAPPGGGWSIRQIVHHIADGDDIWKLCIKAALGNSQGEFDLRWYWDVPQDTWAERWDYAGRALEPSLALFRANRAHVVQLLRQVPDAWNQSIRLPRPDGEIVPISVGYVVEMQARHAEGHCSDIRALRSASQG